MSRNKLVINPNEKYVFIDLVDRGIDVYYSTLLYYLHEAGYVLLFNKRNILFVGNQEGYFKYVHDLKNVFYCNINELHDLNSILYYLYDHNYPKANNNILKSFKLNFDYFNFTNNLSKNKIVVPYPLHPSNYFITKSINYLNYYRKQFRKYKIFFSGNIYKFSYDSIQLKEAFGINSRFETIEYLKCKLIENQLIIVDNDVSWNNIQENGFNGLVLIDWYWNPKETYNMGVKIDASKWLETLSYSSFFLACPGVVMPHSHNLFEAMAVGTIPIIQFGEIFYPPLEDNVNAIFFKDLEDLILKINYIINLNENEISKLSENVIKYYETQVSPKSFGNKLDILEYGKYEMYINVEYFSVLNL